MKGVVEETNFGGWVGTAKRLGDESSHGERLAQVFQVARGVL